MSFRSSFMLFVFSISVFAVTTVALTPISTESSPKCYFIDGSFDPAGGPCYGNVGASMCCYDGEECVSLSGLCLATPNGLAGQYDNGSSIWRRSCTDVTWQDPACLAIAYSVGVKSIQLSNCSDGSFCPRTKDNVNSTCCEDNRQGQFAILGHARIPESAVSSIRATAKSTVTAAPSRTKTASSSTATAPVSHTGIPTSPTASASSSVVAKPLSTPSGGLGQSAKIGIGVGVSFGTLAIALISYIAIRRYKTSKRSKPKATREEPAVLSTKGSLENEVTMETPQMLELTGEERRGEMYTGHNTHEMEGRAGA